MVDSLQTGKKWLWDNRQLIGGHEWTQEPEVLRFFFGRMKEIGNWQEKLVEKFKADYGAPFAL